MFLIVLKKKLFWSLYIVVG